MRAAHMVDLLGASHPLLQDIVCIRDPIYSYDGEKRMLYPISKIVG